MRILYIHQYFQTRQGSGGTRSYEFARRWVRNGHQVTVITGVTARSDLKCSERISRLNMDGIEVLALNSKYSNYMSFFKRIAAFFSFMFRSTWVGMHRVGDIDVVLATSTPLTVGIPGYLVSLWKRVPFVFEIRDLWPEAPIQMGALRNPVAIGLARWLERFLYRVAVHVVTLSPGMLDALKEMGVPTTKLSMIPNCSDTDIFVPRPPDPQIVDRYGVTGKFVVSYAGAMGMANGLQVIVETARILQNSGETDIHFLLIGDGSERPKLDALLQKYKLQNVTLLAPIPKMELAQFLPMSQLCLTIFAPFPVLETTSPNKLFDALALGRPVLINYGGWAKFLLEEHNAGVAVPSNNPEEIAQTIIKLRSQPELCAEMGRNARHLAETEFARDMLAERMEMVLKAAVSNHKVRS